jgi:hypothetical protein
MKKKLLQSIKIITLGLLLSAGISYAATIWSPPLSGPSTGNRATPINASNKEQGIGVVPNTSLLYVGGNSSIGFLRSNEIKIYGDAIVAGNLTDDMLGGGGTQNVCANTAGILVICNAAPIITCGSADNTQVSSIPTSNLCSDGSTPTPPVSGGTNGPWSWTCGTNSCSAAMIAPGPFTLSLNRVGSGTGTVMSSPTGINCGSDCSESYASGTVVTLTPTANSVSIFGGWSGTGAGACTGSSSSSVRADGSLSASVLIAQNANDCVVTMNAAKSITATFNLPHYALSVTKNGTGTGTVTSDVGGINCGTGSGCSKSYNPNTQVNLTATPTAGTFTNWGGACSGTSTTCNVTMGAAKSVTATFTAAAATLTASLTDISTTVMNSTLKAVAGGTATGTTTYEFKCFDTDTWHASSPNTNNTYPCPYTASTPTTYKAWVRITKGSLNATASLDVCHGKKYMTVTIPTATWSTTPYAQCAQALKIEAWGGGGGGGGGGTCNYQTFTWGYGKGGAGGYAGSYATNSVALVNETLTIITGGVGAGGAAGLSHGTHYGGNGTAGGISSVASHGVSAAGGQGGAGGAGAISSTTNGSTPGGNGANSTYSTNGGAGGAHGPGFGLVGTAPDGFLTYAGAGSSGSVGSSGGGGGGGGGGTCDGGHYYDGGAGANGGYGRVILSW